MYIYIYWYAEGNLCSGPYFTEAVEIMKKNKGVCNFLGEPVRIKVLKLGSKENVISKENAQVCTDNICSLA